ncbi:MAG: type II toxin-antitoxin system VapC family toxin [Acidobacteriaceae bacterium]|nr:type II toxin-antitoxin system VapC family toxin [Acidobacteriaceae bacterium]
MGGCVYFDTSVFLAIFNGEPTAKGIRGLLRELKREKARIYTSIITVQEVSVLSFRAGRVYDDNHAKVAKLARLFTANREVALTAAKLEAQIIDQTTEKDQVENRRRKWDCFHIATAMVLGCQYLYTIDDGMLRRKDQLRIKGISFLEPAPRSLDLFASELPTVQ